MNIVWNKNPLYTQIFLDEHEKELLKYKALVTTLLDEGGYALFLLDETKDYYSPERAKDALSNSFDFESKKELMESYEEIDYMIETLEKYPHVGDCTCVPCSCEKCRVEYILGIDTIKGLGKHAAYKIDAAFGKDNERSIEEAIEYLKNYRENFEEPEWDGWEAHYERWMKEAESAYEWLVKYKDEHFKS